MSRRWTIVLASTGVFAPVPLGDVHRRARIFRTESHASDVCTKLNVDLPPEAASDEAPGLTEVEDAL